MSPAPFAVSSETLEAGIDLVAVRGELDTNTAPELEAKLETAIAGSNASMVLDLSECEFIDSTGIALIVGTWQQLNREDGRRMVLCCANQQVRRLLEITGVDDSIPMHEERDRALAELRG